MKTLPALILFFQFPVLVYSQLDNMLEGIVLEDQTDTPIPFPRIY